MTTEQTNMNTKQDKTKTAGAQPENVPIKTSNQCECGKWFMSQAQLSKHRAKGHPRHMTTGARSQETAYLEKASGSQNAAMEQMVKRHESYGLRVAGGKPELPQHSPLPSKWHDCDIAEKQIKQLQRKVAHAEALAEALRDMVKSHYNMDNLEPRHWKAADAALAKWEVGQ